MADGVGERPIGTDRWSDTPAVEQERLLAVGILSTSAGLRGREARDGVGGTLNTGSFGH